eukprot:378555-Pelagomonas_calceolata.AAC.1
MTSFAHGKDWSDQYMDAHIGGLGLGAAYAASGYLIDSVSSPVVTPAFLCMLVMFQFKDGGPTGRRLQGSCRGWSDISFATGDDGSTLCKNAQGYACRWVQVSAKTLVVQARRSCKHASCANTLVVQARCLSQPTASPCPCRWAQQLQMIPCVSSGDH